MASTKVPPALPPARAGATAVRTPAMKNAPVVTKAAPAIGAKTIAAAAVSATAEPPAAPEKPALPATSATSAVAAVTRTAMVIAFIDLARFQIASRRLTDEALAQLVQDYYERVADGLKGAGGRVVKFMGDGALAVFPIDRASQAVRAMILLKQEIDARMAKRKVATALVIRVNAGDVMAGDYGPKSDRRFDVIGNAVNRAAAMRYSEGLSLTSDTYEKLDAKTQKLFRAKGDVYIPA
jgi:class 3 adenylate cyclase